MLRIVVMISVIALFFSCAASNIPSVKSLVEYEKSRPPVAESVDTYLIGPGDVLSIDVRDEADLTKQVTVRLDGHITLPLLNDVDVVGLTCTELREKLTNKYKTYILKTIEILVTVVDSVNNKIYIDGQINAPGEYPLQKHMTILQAIARAGGLADFAKASDIRLIRKINGAEKPYRVDYNAIVSGNDLSQNVQLKPDDTIYVP